MMKNPLLKRIPKELVQELGKYLVIFLFLTLTIGFVSGFLVADSSMTTAFDNSFEDYNIEDGHFTLETRADQKLIEELQEKEVTIYEDFYIEETLHNNHLWRIYHNRDQVDKVSLMEGNLPTKDKEIAIDRLYAQNNGINVGDDVDIAGEKFTICGLVAFSDYTSLFKSNTDSMFDAQGFTVALVNEEVFHKLGDSHLFYRYVWKNQEENLTAIEKRDKAEELMEVLAVTGTMTDFVKEADNQAIHFAGDDMGKDKGLMTFMLYIVIVIMAFIFAITTGNTIEKEASVIGTLRASGYMKSEILIHYMLPPVLVSFVAAVVGNILGYTFFKDIVADLYYGSYSLPPYVTIWNGEAFVLTTLVPCLLLIVVNAVMLLKKLSLSPLKFLRHDLKKNRRQKAIKLPDFSFLTRFRLRVIFQNFPTYLMLVFGILLANILVVFGLMMTPLMYHYKDETLSSMFCNYQYMLKAPVETKTEGAEKFAALSLKREDNGEEITVYGVEEDSSYLPRIKELSEGELLMSAGYFEKYGVSVGDEIQLTDKYEEEHYNLTLNGKIDYPSGLCIFMKLSDFCEIFDKEEGYFTGYYSDEKITDIDEMYIASTITEHDMTILADQLLDSMGGLMPLWTGFAIVLFMLLTYLLSKLIIEKNASSISMVKILGYQNMEVGKLYVMSTVLVVAFSIVISIPVSYFVIKKIYYVMMTSMFTGWLDYYVAKDVFVKMVLLNVAAYVLIGILELGKIGKIPMEEALKNAE